MTANNHIQGAGPVPPPDFADVPYGTHAKQALDLWKARTETPSPLAVYIHGGGFSGGDKKQIDTYFPLGQFLKAGISCASINYRLTKEKDVYYPAPMLDGARAVQFLRSKAAEWGLDASRVAALGESAGAGISLWLGFRKDLADPASEDAVARQSTRLSCMAVFEAQCSYDPRFVKRHIPQEAYKQIHLQWLFGLRPEEILEPPAEKARLIEEASPVNHLAPGAPPVFLRYTRALEDPRGDIHHPKFGAYLKARMDELKIECVLSTLERPAKPEAEVDFVRKHFGMK